MSDDKLSDFTKNVLLQDKNVLEGVRKPDYSQPPRDDGTEFKLQSYDDVTKHLGSQNADNYQPDDAPVAKNLIPDNPWKGQQLDSKKVHDDLIIPVNPDADTKSPKNVDNVPAAL